MDLSFAKDASIFSKAVEQLRAEGGDLNDASVIEERYNELSKGGKKEKDVEADTAEDAADEADAPAPKAPKAKTAKRG